MEFVLAWEQVRSQQLWGRDRRDMKDATKWVNCKRINMKTKTVSTNMQNDTSEARNKEGTVAGLTDPETQRAKETSGDLKYWLQRLLLKGCVKVVWTHRSRLRRWQMTESAVGSCDWRVHSWAVAAPSWGNCLKQHKMWHNPCYSISNC